MEEENWPNSCGTVSVHSIVLIICVSGWIQKHHKVMTEVPPHKEAQECVLH